MEEDADPDVRDAILIALAQKVEHYEIAPRKSLICLGFIVPTWIAIKVFGLRENVRGAVTSRAGSTYRRHLHRWLSIYRPARR